MSGEPPANKSGKSRRRRRRKRPAQKGQQAPGENAPQQRSGDAPQQRSGDAPQQRSGDAPQQQGAPSPPRGAAGQPGKKQDSDGKSRSRRPRRRPRKRAEGDRPADGARASQQPTQQKAEGSKRRRRRRKRKPAKKTPERERTLAPETADEGLALEEHDDVQDAKGFPDEDGWDLGETEPPAPPPPAPALPELIDADDLVLELDLDPDTVPEGEMHNVAMVRFRDRASVHAYEAGELNLDGGERVVVETEQGHVVGSVARRSQRTLIRRQLPRLLRRIDHNDMRQEARNTFREREAFEFCRERIAARSLPMKLIRVEYLHGGNKAIFYFAAEHRVDFRELVKDLAQRFHTRIVMRQVGVRDEAKMTGGIGSCGMPLCCAGWLPKFEPVSIRMAKDQNLVLNPQKVSGQCGRLKCCLTYEQALYQEARRNLPKTGRTVKTPDGDGRVQEIDILRGIVRVSLSDGKMQTYRADQIEPISGGKPPAKQ